MANESDSNRLNTSLYVGDLHPFVTENTLKDFFSKIGPVKNVRICRDTTTQHSLGYGYVNFKTHEHAVTALENLNFEPITHRPCRLMWAQRDPNLRRSGKYNLFVKNLGKDVTQKQLYDSCELFGTILSAKIATDEYGISKGYGFVHFATEEGYLSALDFLNGYKINDSKKLIYAGPFIPKTERKSMHDPNNFNNCYVKNFGENLDDEALRTMFEKYGKIISCVVMKDSEGKSKGFGFVCFENPENAMAACDALNNTEVNGNPIYVGKAIRKEKRLEEVKEKQAKLREERKSKYGVSVNLYVKNLDPSFDDEDLRKNFMRFGEITSSKIMRNEEGKSRGFGFVCFKEAESAAKAVSEMKNHLVGTKPLYVAIAQRKEERHNKLVEVFRTKFEDMNNMVSNVGFFNNHFQSNQRFYSGSVLPPRRDGNHFMPHMNSGQLSQNQFGVGNPAMQRYTAPMTSIRSQPGMARSSVHPPMVGGLNPANVRPIPRGNMPGFPNQQMPGRMVPNMNLAVRTNNPNANSNVQYNQNARNVAVPQNSEEVKTRLGNKLMPIVASFYPDHASRLTGILLSMDTERLEKLFENETALKEQIDEGYSRLRKHEEANKKPEVK